MNDPQSDAIPPAPPAVPAPGPIDQPAGLVDATRRGLARIDVVELAKQATVGVGSAVGKAVEAATAVVPDAVAEKAADLVERTVDAVGHLRSELAAMPLVPTEAKDPTAPGSIAGYVASIPERMVRSAAGTIGGLAKEGGDVLLPPAILKSAFWEGFIGSFERYLVKDLGRVQGVFAEGSVPQGFLTRKFIGNVVEVGSLIALHASPLLVLAIAADVVKGGNAVFAEMVKDLRRDGVIAADAKAGNLGEFLDRIQEFTAGLARQVDVPPLTRAELAQVADDLREQLQAMAGSDPYRVEELEVVLEDLRQASAQQKRSTWEVAAAVGHGVIAASGCSVRLLGRNFLAPYRDQFVRLREMGFATYLQGAARPYYQAVGRNWNPRQATSTEQLLDRALRLLGWIGDQPAVVPPALVEPLPPAPPAVEPSDGRGPAGGRPAG